MRKRMKASKSVYCDGNVNMMFHQLSQGGTGGRPEHNVERGPMLRGVWADTAWSVGRYYVECEPILRAVF